MAMKQILRFEGPDGKGPACGGHFPSHGEGGTFFHTYLWKMTSARCIEGFRRGTHFCGILPEKFGRWCPPQALKKAERDELLLCVYTVQKALTDTLGEGQALFAKADVIEVVKITPTDFDPAKHLTLFEKMEAKANEVK